jgi:hypothetical protein
MSIEWLRRSDVTVRSVRPDPSSIDDLQRSRVITRHSLFRPGIFAELARKSPIRRADNLS